MRKSLLAAALLAATAATAATPAPSPNRTVSLFPRTARHFAAPRQDLPGHEGAWAETFEGYQKGPDVYAWLPDGWSRKGNEGLAPNETWFVTNTVGYTAPAEGDYFAAINMNQTTMQDEWLMTPPVTVNPGDELSYYVFYNPLYFFDQALINWGTMEWYSQIQTSTLQLLARPEGSEDWQVLRDYASEFKRWDPGELQEFADASHYDMWRDKQSISQYEGQNVQFAFRYQGRNGDAVFLDVVRVGKPIIDGVSYRVPLSVLRWGMECRDGIWGQEQELGLAPANVDLAWANDTGRDDLAYEWEYRASMGGAPFTSNDTDLTFKFEMPMDDPSGLAHNLVEGAPVLRASLPNGSEGSYSYPFDAIQAGGEATTSGGTRMGLLPFSHIYDGIDIATDKATGTPVFGRGAGSDEWWTAQYFGKNAASGDKARLVAIANAMPAPESPLVVDGLWLNAKGRDIADDAVLTASIIPCRTSGSEFEPLDTPLATATCTGAQMLENERQYVTIPFEFDAPVVLDGTYPLYLVEISGLDSDKIGYLAPVQSSEPFADRRTVGWTRLEVTSGTGAMNTWRPMADVKIGNMACFNAFAINLGAYYPWIDPRELNVSLADGAVELPLPGYYDASEYKFTLADGSPLPQGLDIEGQGRYDKGTLFIDYYGKGGVDCEVRITAPGVDKLMHLYDKPLGVGQVEAGQAVSGPVYDLLGRRVEGRPAPGVYVSGGKKFVVK